MCTGPKALCVPFWFAALFATRPATAEPPAPKPPAQIPYYHRRWALFDPLLSARETVLFGGPSSLREVGVVTPLRGGSFGLALTQRESKGPLWLSMQRDFELHIHSRWSFLLELSRYTYEAGLHLGPVEIGVGPSVTPIGVDISDGDFSLSGLSPRATAKLGVKTGRVRFSLRAYREYLWRWLGRDDAWMTGFVLELGLEAPKRTHWGSHPIVVVR
ncbi:MAG TPA: hypothetical protein VGK73_27955 [Polyangiaceae bacterium]